LPGLLVIPGRGVAANPESTLHAQACIWFPDSLAALGFRND
jgi:hypothetical protein